MRKIFNWKKFLAGFALVVVALFFSTHIASAAIVNCGNGDSSNIEQANTCSFSDLFSAAISLINYFLEGAAVVAVGGVVYGGYLMVTSAGNASHQESGKKAVTNSMIGLAIILLAFLLVKSVFTILNFKGGSPIENPNGVLNGGFNLINGGNTLTPTPPGGGGGGTVPNGTAQELANQLIAKAGVACFYPQHVGGHAADGATARDNIQQTAAGQPAKRSSYGTAPGGTVALDASMLRGLLAIFSDPTIGTSNCPVTALAGSSHTAGSAHYQGKAFDLDKITNQGAVIELCSRYGASLAQNESNHIHCQWP